MILGTTRKGRMSAHAARFVADRLANRPGVETELIDIADLPLPVDDAGEAIKHPRFGAAMERADALVLVAPEYNRSFPGLLKHVLDTCLKEYIHKSVGIVGVSAGPFGATRLIEGCLPVLRELGLVAIFWDVNVGNVTKVFDDSGALLDPAYVRRTDKFLAELVWMAKTLRYGRDHITLEPVGGGDEAGSTGPGAATMECPKCGGAMNHHADKLVAPVGARDADVLDPELEGVLRETHGCPACGKVEFQVVSRPARQQSL